MKHFKNIILILCLIILAGCGSNANAGESEVYATSINHNLSVTTFYVDDSIDIGTSLYRVVPSNTTFKPEVILSSSSIAKIENNKIIFMNSGTLNITLKIQSSNTNYVSSEFEVVVKDKPVYAQSITFDYDNLVVNLDETAINKFTPNEIGYNQSVTVSFLHGNIIDYNIITGVITPINVGDEQVTITLKKDEYNTITKTFNVSVTNYVYAESISYLALNGVNILNTSELTVFTSDVIELDFNAYPSKYNLPYSVEFNNEDASYYTDYTYENTVYEKAIVAHAKGEIDVVFSVVGRDKIITKSIKINVVDKAKLVDFSIADTLGNTPQNYFVGEEYVLTVNESYQGDIAFENANVTNVSGNIYKLVFTNVVTQVGLLNTITGTLSTSNATKYLAVNVYNKAESLSYYLTLNNQTLVSNNQVYTLELPNMQTYNNIEIKPDIAACIVVNLGGVNLIDNNYEITFVGSSITYANGVITPVALGETEISITTLDGSNLVETFKINVVKLNATSIEVSTTNLDLVLNDPSNVSAELTYRVVPSYAYDEVNLSYDNTVIKIEGNIVTALKAGNTTIVISCGEVYKNVVVFVSLMPTRIEAYLNYELITEDTIYIKQNTDVVLGYKVFSDLVEVDAVASVKFNNATFVINQTVEFSEVGTFSLVITVNDIVKTITIVVYDYNPVISAEFSTNVTQVLLSDGSIEIDYVLTKQNSNVDTTDEVSLSVDNLNVASLNNNTLSLHEVGSVNVSLLVNSQVKDVLKLVIANTQLIEISTAEQFANIDSNQNYLLTRNINLSGYSGIDNFAGYFNFNEYSISGLSTSLFNTLAESAVLENIGLSYVTTLLTSGLIANTNNGTIKNIVLNNCNIAVSLAQAALIVDTNNGTISGVEFINCSVTFNAAVNFAGVSFNNNGSIFNVFGSLTISKESDTLTGGVVAGIVYTNNAEAEVSNLDCENAFNLILVGNPANAIYILAGMNHGSVNNFNVNVDLGNNLAESDLDIWFGANMIGTQILVTYL